MIIDTHCHIHDSEFYLENREEAYRESRDAGVIMVCVSTNIRSSREAIEFCGTHAACYPIIGIHPHDAKDNDSSEIRALVEANRERVIGIGEIGLDYFYSHSDREIQIRALREQLQIAQDFNLPVSFHVREAFDDFWPIFDEFPGIHGVLHSFTDNQTNLDEAIKRGLLIGINGISTFTKEPLQKQLFTDVALKNILLETDAPFLTPTPLRGKVNSPAYVTLVAKHQAELKAVSIDEVIRATTANAQKVFGIQ